MRLYVLLLAILTNLSCSTLFNRKPANSTNYKARHVIITVHGLSGDALTWGDFSGITKNYLEQIDRNYDVIVSNFTYPTGRTESLTTVDFANLLNKHIENLFKDQPITPDDRISLVAHSQGGVVSYIWYFSRVLDDKLEQKYIRQVSSIITLGTPFWGSKLASMLTDKNVPNMVPLLNLFAETPVSRRELTDMAFGSDVINNFRQLAIKMDSDPKVKAKLDTLPVRLINIMGILPEKQESLYATSDVNNVSGFAKKLLSYIYKLFRNSANGPDRVESDIAVMVPSGRWDFIYSPIQKINSGSNHIAADQFNHFTNLVDRSKFLFTESAHLPFDNDNTLSMAYINKSCEKVETCNHPTYRYILQHLANCKSQACDPEKYTQIIEGLKNVKGSFYSDEKGDVRLTQHQSYKNIKKHLQTFSLQIDMKLKPGQISRFPVKYFVGQNLDTEGKTIWELREPTLLGKVIDLKRDQYQISKSSPTDLAIYIGPTSERRGIDIISRESKTVDGNDVIRMNIVGYVRKTAKTDIRETAKLLVIPLSINLPGLPSVDIEAAVQPGYSTYLPLDYTGM